MRRYLALPRLGFSRSVALLVVFELVALLVFVGREYPMFNNSIKEMSSSQAAMRLGPKIDQTLLRSLFEITKSKDVDAALEEVQTRGVAVQLGEGIHALGHVLGAYAYELSDQDRALSGRCATDLAYGCFHGVVSRYVGDTRRQPVLDVPNLCGGLFAKNEGAEQQTSACWHAVGHGLALRSGANWDVPLSTCATLPGSAAVKCADGVYMAAARGMSAAYELAPLLRDDDLLYPCATSVVPVNLREACYSARATSLAHTEALPWPDLVQLCATTWQYQDGCVRGLGFGMYWNLMPDLAAAARRCQEVGARRATYCLLGLIGNPRLFPPAVLDICAQLLPLEGPNCYSLAGQRVAEYTMNPAEREALCASAPTDYRAACRRSAGLN